MESWISDLGLQRSIANARIAVVPQYSLSFAMERNKPYLGRRLSAFQSLEANRSPSACLFDGEVSAISSNAALINQGP